MGGFDTIPRIGFHNADGWCETRSGLVSDVEQWGIQALFSISVTAAEHTPALAERMFAWPNFVETDVFRDYGLPKITPLLITGSQDPQYPWRHRVYKQLADHFPSVVRATWRL